MNYEGKLYGKIGKRYFDTGKTANDFDEKEDSLLKFIGLLNEVCNAWESLEGGKSHTSNHVNQWLKRDMKPIMDKIRKELDRDIPK